MFGYFTDHEYTLCERCGMSVDSADQRSHVCDAGLRARFEDFQVLREVTQLDGRLATFLRSPAGRFAVYCAERDRIRRAA